MILTILVSIILYIPEQKGYVNDYTNFLTDVEIQQLETKLQEIATRDSVKIIVVTVDSLNGLTPVEFTNQLGDQWEIWYQSTNQEVVILLSRKEEAFFITTDFSYPDKVPIITDNQHAAEKYALPLINEGAYYGGISNAIDAMKGKWKSSQTYTDSSISIFAFIILILLFAGLVAMIIQKGLRRLENRNNPWNNPGNDNYF